MLKVFASLLLATSACQVIQAQTNVVAQTINGIPQADQFAGVDMCDKIHQASVWGIAHAIYQIDATHFSGVQACTVNPLAGLASVGTPLPLTLNLGVVHIVTSVPWTITNSLVHLRGMGTGLTIMEYGAVTGQPAPSPTAAIVTISTGTPSGTSFVDGVGISDITLLGDATLATDGILMEATHHSEFRNINTWGVTGCGIHTRFAVTDTFYRPRTSIYDFNDLNINNGSSYTSPAHGLCFDSVMLSGQNLKTTDGTVIDAAAENVTGVGWLLANANGMTFTSGTSENNGAGIEIDALSTANSFIDVDLESNTGNNVADNGTSTTFVNPVMDSHNTVLGPHSIAFNVIGGNITSPIVVDPAAQAPAMSFGNVDFMGRTVIGLKIGPDNRPSITSSVGAPPATCQSGSIYLNAAGGTGTTFFVCESGGWVAK